MYQGVSQERERNWITVVHITPINGCRNDEVVKTDWCQMNEVII